MILGLCLITVTCLGWAIATVATRPADRGTRRRRLARRFRQVRRHPEQANLLDVENLLISDSISATTVARVLDKAHSRRIGARTMWRWAATHGSDKVVLVIGADLAEDTLLDHLDAGTAPDWPSVGVLANLNGHAVVPAMAHPTCPDDLSGWDFATPAGIWDNEDPQAA